MKKVMIVDHSSAMRNHLAAIVIGKGYEAITQAADGIEAVQLYERHHPDLVIIDAILPKLNGLAAAKAILKRDPLAKIIFCSAIGHRTFIMEVINAGVSDYIVKPVLDENIVMQLEKHFQ